MQLQCKYTQFPPANVIARTQFYLHPRNSSLFRLYLGCIRTQSVVYLVVSAVVSRCKSVVYLHNLSYNLHSTALCTRAVENKYAKDDLMAVFDFNKLTRRRDELHMTNRQIASLKGISETTLSRIFKGETKDPSFSVVADICDVLQVSLDDVAGIGVSDKDLPDESPAGMIDALGLMRDHISRIVYHVRSVEHEKDLAYIRQIEQLQEQVQKLDSRHDAQLAFRDKQLSFRTVFLYGSVVLNVVLIALVAVISLIP